MGERQAEWCDNFVVKLFPKRLGPFEKEKITLLVGEHFGTVAGSSRLGLIQPAKSASKLALSGPYLADSHSPWRATLYSRNHPNPWSC